MEILLRTISNGIPMNWLIAILSALLLTACEQKQFTITAKELAAVEPTSVGQTEQALINLLREKSGIRSQLGDGAEEVFQRVDRVRTRIVWAIMQQRLSQIAMPRLQERSEMPSVGGGISRAINSIKGPAVAFAAVEPGEITMREAALYLRRKNDSAKFNY